MLEITEIIVPAGLPLAPEGLFDGRGEIRVLIHTQEQINLRDFLQQILRIALREAAGDHQQAAAAGFLILRHIEDRIDRLLLGGIDKPAGVHEEDVRLLGIFRQDKAFFRQQPQGCFGIHAVFVAAEGNGAYRICHETDLPSVCRSA